MDIIAFLRAVIISAFQFQPSYSFLEPTRVDPLMGLGSTQRLLACGTNIRIEWKCEAIIIDQ
jgi:hypothetical protein